MAFGSSRRVSSLIDSLSPACCLQTRHYRYLSSAFEAGSRWLGSPCLAARALATPDWDGLPVAVPDARDTGLVRVSSGLVYRRPATRGGRAVGQGGQVAGGVEIPVHDQAAPLAPEHPLGQAQLGFHRAATRAGLRGRVEPVGGHQPPAVPCGLL